MPDEPSSIPLSDVLRAANELVSAGLIEDYALGGALAAIYYVEPFTTYDADIIFVTKDKTLSAGIPRIYNPKVGASNASICCSTIFPSSFWPRPD